MKTRSKALDDKFHNWHIVNRDNIKNTYYNYKSALNHLRNNYVNPRSGISFSGVNKIYNYYNRIIPISEINQFLSENDSYTLHSKTFKKKFNPTFIKYKGQQFQADLIDVGNLSRSNDGINFLLTIICSFTKKAWISPLKSKKGENVLKGFKSILKVSEKIPRSILTDAGGEFNLVRKWCVQQNINTYLPYSSLHGAIVERFNQTIKNRIYRWMDHFKTERYIPHLDNILEGYNNSNHRSIGVSPNIAWNDKSIHPQIREKLQLYYDKFKHKKPKFQIGDIVRIKLLHKSSFFKGYDIQNNQELFEIYRVTINLPVPMYEIQSLENPNEGVLKGKFYEYELTKVTNK